MKTEAKSVTVIYGDESGKTGMAMIPLADEHGELEVDVLLNLLTCESCTLTDDDGAQIDVRPLQFLWEPPYTLLAEASQEVMRLFGAVSDLLDGGEYLLDTEEGTYKIGGPLDEMPEDFGDKPAKNIAAVNYTIDLNAPAGKERPEVYVFATDPELAQETAAEFNFNTEITELLTQCLMHIKALGQVVYDIENDVPEKERSWELMQLD